jgi:hypothetical protein
MVRKIGWFLFFVVVASSCLDEPECFSLNNNIVGISFRKLLGGQADTVYFHRITSEGTDSVFYETTLATGIDLPLNYYQNQTTYHFEGLGAAYDLQFDYKAQAQFVSEDCGERFVLSDLAVASVGFDSLRLMASTPKRDRQAGTHLEIYRCPMTSRIELRFAEPVTITGASADYQAALFLLSTEPVSTFDMPLNPAANQTTVTLNFADSIKVLTVSYLRDEDSTIFDICGPQTVLSEFGVVNHNFTSAEVIRKTIQDPLLTNIEITF